VTIADTTSGAILYCTTDGTTPTTSSSVCSNPTTVSKTEFLQAIAVAPGKSASAVASAGYVINLNVAPTPTFSPTGGTYTGAQSVTIGDSLSGANIYYTTDGTTPSASGCSSTPSASATLYTGPITVSQSETLNAIATASGYCTSGVASAAYAINAALSAPTINSNNGLSPSSVIAGASAFTLTVNGTNFTSAATVLWNGTALTTTYVSATQLTAAVSASLIATASMPNVSVMTASGVSSAATFTINAPTPSITGVTQNGASVTAALMGSTVTINGTNFGSTQGTSIVAFGNVLATIKSWSATAITVTVPTDATAGSVNLVVTVGGVASNAYSLTLDSPTPVVTSISPTAAGVGQTVKIYGNSFGTNEAAVSIGGAAVITISKWIDTEIDVVVPSNAVSGDVIVTVNGNASATSSTTKFTLYPAPSITYLSETVMTAGDSVTITGVNFGATQVTTSTITFGGVAATAPSWSDTQIVATVPTGATSGDVVVTVNGVSSSGYAYKLAAAKLSGFVKSGDGTGATAIPLSATVQLYAAGTTGYGNAPAPVGSAVTTDIKGAFTVGFDCSSLTAPGDQLYLVAVDKSSSNIVLMAALGSCNTVATNYTSGVAINEVTTIASAYALSGFAILDSTSGIDIGAPATYDATNAPKCDASPDNWQSTGANTCNYLGLQNAFKTVNNLVNIGNGQALTITPYYANLGATSGDVLNSSYVPQARINSLANFLASCVQGTSGCSTLFSAAGNSSLKDTLQVALYIAQHPGANVATLYALQTAEATPPYTPELTSAPNDWTIALTFTGGGLGLTPTIAAGGNPGQAPSVKGVVIDATGHIWLAVNNGCLDLNSYSSVGEIVEFDNQGNAVSPAATNTNSYCGGFQPQYNGSAAFGGGNIALDQEGNLWGAAAQNSSIAKVSANGKTGAGVYDLSTVPVTSGYSEQCDPSSLAADASGHMWMGCSDGNGNGTGGIAAVNTSDGSTFGGENLDNPGKPTQTSIAELDSIALDPLGSVLGVIANPTPLGNSFSSADLYQISATSKSAVLNDYSTIGRTFVNSVVVDNSNNVFSISATLGTINALAPDGTTWTSLSYPMPASADGASIGMEQLALDGAGNLWGPVCAGDLGSVGAPSYLVRMTADGHLLSPSTATVYGYTGSGGGGENQVVLTNWAPYQPAMTGVAIDGSGNLWITNYSLPNSYLVPAGTPNGQQLVEFVGIAAPVTTPAVQALANNALGARP
jgi:hypothetical protein